MRRTDGAILVATLGLVVAGGCYAEVTVQEEPRPPCEPRSCTPGHCGVVPDGCGGLLSCWCDSELICDETGQLGICIEPPAPTCEELGAECGSVAVGGIGTVYCGECRDAPCGAWGAAPNRCPCARRADRLGSLDEDPADPGRRLYTGNPLVTTEAGEPYLYFTTSLWGSGSESDSMLARARFLSPTELDLDTLEPIPGTGDGSGWPGNPAVGVSGRELFFDSSRPDADWSDPEIYLSVRASPEAAWEPPLLVPSVGDPALADDGVSAPVLLPDGRTLLYWEVRNRVAKLALRDSPVAGDRSFLPLPDPAFTDPPEVPGDESQLVGFSLSCDRAHVLYLRETWNGSGAWSSELRQVGFTGLSPTTFGPPGPYARIAEPPLPAASREDRIVRFAETADCSAIYFATFSGGIYHLAVLCEP